MLWLWKGKSKLDVLLFLSPLSCAYFVEELIQSPVLGLVCNFGWLTVEGCAGWLVMTEEDLGNHYL